MTLDRSFFIFTFFVLLFMSSTLVHGEEIEDRRSIGISASLQGNQTSLLIPCHLGDKIVVVPGFYFVHVSDVGSDIGVTLGIRFKIKDGKSIPYVGVQYGLLISMPEDGINQYDMILGPMLGGEHFIGNRFSLGVEFQLNIAISDEFSNRFGKRSSTVVNSATAAMATFYF